MTVALNEVREVNHFSNAQLENIKKHFCKGINDLDSELFMAVCRKTGLDPFTKQIYAVARNGVMTIQTSIDGYRLIAERTGKYVPGRESTFVYKKDGSLYSATSYVKKRTNDGQWHEIAATALFSEYKPAYKNNFWSNMPHVMLAKCAEAAVLRRAFPNELSGTYIKDEMDQGDHDPRPTKMVSIKDESKKPEDLPYADFEESEAVIDDEQAEFLDNYFAGCSSDYQVKFNEWMTTTLKINTLSDLKAKDYNRIERVLKAKFEENQAKDEETDVEELIHAVG